MVPSPYQKNNSLPWSVVDNLQHYGIIGRRAYSLYLNDGRADTGVILFGGIDTTKYSGELKSVPINVSCLVKDALSNF
jgi:hypothetical protein